jgi:hypothetical protein
MNVPGSAASSRRGVLAAALFATLLAPAAFPLQAKPGSRGRSGSLHPVDCTRVADPKLAGGGVEISYLLDPSSAPYDVQIVAISNATGAVVATIAHEAQFGSTSPKTRFWSGRDPSGRFVDPGSYTIRVTARNGVTISRKVEYPVDVVRLGIESIAAQSSASSSANEWQTVYFRKNSRYVFYATPSTHEFLSAAEKGEISDLDLDDGSPRPAPPVHAKTDEPLLELGQLGTGYKFEDDWYNYPLCYLAGAEPRFDVTFGSTCTLAGGTQGTAGYPVAGLEIRCIGSDEAGEWSSSTTSLVPGGIAAFEGPALPAEATRTERTITWRFECRPTGAADWSPVPGSFATTHRIYTILDQPYFAAGASGTQYAGPWVEVLEYLYTFATALSIRCDTDEAVVEALIKGFFGQNGSLTTAIEDVHYDCPSEGGDGGATHYFDWGRWVCRLSHLLNAHADGKFVNCTDCATCTSVMLSMLGIADLELDRLGSMTLRAIWGIGTDDYTLDLWSNGGGPGHGFSYHHIITRDGGEAISDACLWVDEDGNPDKLPGSPGYNHDRDWDNYESLLAKGNVNWFTELLPEIE